MAASCDSSLVYQHAYIHPTGRVRPKNTKIDTILIRCLKTPDLTTLLNNYERHERASHYVIDKAGYVGQLVWEKYTSELFADNKHYIEDRLISITLGFDSTANPTTEILDKLKLLLEDVCRRNNIEKLVWSASSTKRVERTDGCNVLLYSDISGDEEGELLFRIGAAKSVCDDVTDILEEAAAGAEKNNDKDQTLPVPAGGNVNTASLISKSDVIAKNNYLTESEMQTNARYVWQYFGSQGWTLNAVAGMLGNMESESNINPGLWQNQAVDVGPAFGITQWDPFSKIINWQNELGVPIEDIDGQLLKIKDEVDMCGKAWVEGRSQWITKDEYPLSFQEFTTSTESPEYLAEVFLRNYERAGVEVLETRKEQAIKWYNYLIPFSNLNPPTAIFLRITEIGDDYITARCELENIATSTAIRLSALDEEGEVVQKTDVTVEHEATEAEFLLKDLAPDTLYTLELIINPPADDEEADDDKEDEPDDSEEEDTEEVIPIITFKTKPGRPDSASAVTLSPLDLPLHDQLFTVNITPPSNWGYWVTKHKFLSYGYTVQLIAQGEILAEQSFSAENMALTFEFTPTLSELFSETGVIAGQTVQVGVKTWVININGVRVYDECAKASNTVCLINNKHRVFIPQAK